MHIPNMSIEKNGNINLEKSGKPIKVRFTSPPVSAGVGAWGIVMNGVAVGNAVIAVGVSEAGVGCGMT